MCVQSPQAQLIIIYPLIKGDLSAFGIPGCQGSVGDGSQWLSGPGSEKDVDTHDSFLRKEDFYGTWNSCYLAAPFNLVTEMIQHPVDIGFGFKVQHRCSCVCFAAPGLEINARMKARSTSAMSAVASAGCSALASTRNVQTVLGSLLLSPLSAKQKVPCVIRYLSCLHIPVEVRLLWSWAMLPCPVPGAGRLPAPCSTCRFPECLQGE